MADETVAQGLPCRPAGHRDLHKLGGIIPHPVFDTQVAAMVCGFGDSIAYDQLVRAGDRRAASTSRRASPTGAAGRCRDKQLDYALADVTHLRDVYRVLRDELAREGPRATGWTRRWRS